MAGRQAEATRPLLYSDVPLPQGSWWKNAAAVQEYNTIKKALAQARSSNNLDTVAAYLKTRQHKLVSRKNIFDVSVLLAFGLGIAMATGIGCVLFSSTLVDFGLFLILLSFFHMWEYNYVSLFHPETLSYECTFLKAGPTTR
jgi:hypothetical protein